MPEELQAALAQQLRDVHLPEPITWWPLAIGWWVLIMLGCIGLTFIIRSLYKKRQRNAYRRLAANALEQHYNVWQSSRDTASYLSAANEVLKRSVLHNALVPIGSAGQSGAPWLATLNHLAQSSLSISAQQALSQECYQPQPTTDVAALHIELLHWLKTHRLLSEPAKEKEIRYA